MAAVTTQRYDPQLGVDATDYVEEGAGAVSSVSHDDPDIAKRPVEPERFCLSTAFLMFDLVATTYRTHVLVKRGYEPVFV